MDFVKNAMGGGDDKKEGSEGGQQSGGGGGFMDKINSAAGGGKESEKNEDYLDKGKSTLPSHLLNLCSHPSQALMLSNNTDWDKATRATNQPSSRPRMSRSPTSFVTSTRVPQATIFPSRTRKQSLVK